VNAAIELAGRDPEVTAQVQHNFTRMEEILRSAIHRAQLDGEIASDKDPGALAQYTLNSMYGLRVLGKTADRKTLAGVVETVLQVL
jgi:TetR/AcrR family transcriptional repressor of nem operon